MYKTKALFAQNHLIALSDYSKDEILQLLSLGMRLKAKQRAGIKHNVLEGKTLGMIFTKSSTRTRVSFEVGAYQLGMHALFLSSADIQLGRGETIEDTAKVLSRMVDGIMIRTFAHSDAVALAEHGTIPVINGLTDFNHPCQALADVMTLWEKRGSLEGAKLAYIGDGNNVCHSLINICGKLGIDISVATPKGYAPDADVAEAAKAFGPAKIELTDDPFIAADGADAVYTDVFASMGQEAEAKARLEVFKSYCVTEAVMKKAKPSAIFLHCLPAHRGEEVESAVIDGSQSSVFDEAENRLHAQKAVMAMLMSGMGYEELMK